MNARATYKRSKAGFTLSELCISGSLSVVVIGMAMLGFVEITQVWHREAIVNELALDLGKAMDWLKHDLRLSSVGVGHMAFYPANGADYTAISLPRAVDTDGDGLLERDSESDITWNETVIYHVRPGDPDELRRTVFTSRNQDSTPAQLYTQLKLVVESTNSSQMALAALGGESVQSRVIFKNLVNMTIRPPDMSFDGYSPTYTKHKRISWGSVVLDSGTHKLKFTVVGKNDNSSGYKVGIDSFALSTSYSQRDGETYLRTGSGYAAGTGTIVAVDMSSYGASWNGKCQMTYDASSPSNTIVIMVPNDQWTDTNFRGPVPELLSNVTVAFDHSFESSSPFIPDYVVTLDKGIAWVANAGSVGNIPFVMDDPISVTNYIFGGTNDAALLTRNGKWVRFRFEAGDGGALVLSSVKIFNESNGVDDVTFDGGDLSVVIQSGESVWSDWTADYDIQQAQTYRVAFTMGGLGDKDLDLIVGNSAGTFNYFENEGTPQSPSWDDLPGGELYLDPLDIGGFSTPAFVDIDDDGDDDLFVGGFDGKITFVERGGDPDDPEWDAGISDWNGIDVGTWSSPAWCDIDADGDQDLFIGYDNGKLAFYENIGDRYFPILAPVNSAWQGIDSGSFSAPAFTDIDADGDFDLFIGQWPDGHISFYENTGTPSNFQHTAAVTNMVMPHPLSHPAFADIDADGDQDLFVGGQDGVIHHYENTGTPSNAVWGTTNLLYSGIDIGSWSAPAFANMNPSIVSAAAETNNSIVYATTNGGPCTAIIGLMEIDVGAADEGLFRSGVFDAVVDAPDYDDLSWVEQASGAGADIDIRIRSADTLGDLESAAWTDANPANDGFFESGSANDLATLPNKRYVQYEARLQCTSSASHTNDDALAKLRDITVEWPGHLGIADLVVDFARGPDYGIVEAMVDNQAFIKGITIELEIFKYSRPYGTNTINGLVEVKPLNSGR